MNEMADFDGWLANTVYVRPSKRKLSNSSSSAIQGHIGEARDRDSNEQVRPQFESPSKTRYW